MSTTTKSRKNGGRVHGSQNIGRLTIIVIPPRCPVCQSTDIVAVGGARITQDIPGVLENGDDYDRVIWRPARCRKCGQHLRQRIYEKNAIAGGPAD